MPDLFRRHAATAVPAVPEGTGCHGKLPILGDFVTRGLRGAVLERWDGWLQQLVSASRATLGPDWQAAWLRMPAWHFILGPSVLTDGPCAGVLIPSVDKVGRSYPFSVLSPIRPDGVLPAGWRAGAEALAIEALEGALDTALLQQRLDRIGCPCVEAGAAERTAVNGESVFWWHPADTDAPWTLRTSGLPDPEHAQALVLGRLPSPDAAGPAPEGGDSTDYLARRPS